jgi:hypothetical protein
LAARDRFGAQVVLSAQHVERACRNNLADRLSRSVTTEPRGVRHNACQAAGTRRALRCDLAREARQRRQDDSLYLDDMTIVPTVDRDSGKARFIATNKDIGGLGGFS